MRHEPRVSEDTAFHMLALRAISDIAVSGEPGTENEHWFKMHGGFNSLPPHSKKEWLAWAQQRGMDGDKRYQLLFSTIARLRLQG